MENMAKHQWELTDRNRLTAGNRDWTSRDWLRSHLIFREGGANFLDQSQSEGKQIDETPDYIRNSITNYPWFVRLKSPTEGGKIWDTELR